MQMHAAVRSVLGTDIGTHDPLMAAGLDSLGATELRNALQRVTGLTLTATVVFDHPTVSALAAHLSTLLSRAAGPVLQARTQSGAASPALVQAASAGQPAAAKPLFVLASYMRLPGGATTPQLQAADACAPVPLQRWDLEALQAPAVERAVRYDIPFVGVTRSADMSRPHNVFPCSCHD